MHNSFVYYVREIFAKNNIGPVPPPIMLLSDGGHVENLAILPLLKRRLPRIVVVDGGHKGGDTFYGESILNAMHLARTKLKCSFLSEDDKDVISDLREKFTKQQNGGNPRHYKYAFILQVTYFVYVAGKEEPVFCHCYSDVTGCKRFLGSLIQEVVAYDLLEHYTIFFIRTFFIGKLWLKLTQILRIC